MREQMTTAFHSSVRRNLMLLNAVMAVAILAAGITALAAITYTRGESEEKSLTSARNLAKALDLSIEGLIGKIDIALLTSADEVSRQRLTGKADARLITGFLALQRERLTLVERFGGTDERGQVIYGPNVQSPRVNISDRDYFVRLRNDRDAAALVNMLVTGRASLKPVWLFARRINKPDGSFDGVVFATVPADQIGGILSGIKINPGDTIGLRDADLRLVAREQFVRITDTPIGSTAVSKPFAAALAEAPRDGTYFSGAAEPDGINRKHVYHRNEKYAFIVNVGNSVKTALVGWRQQSGAIAGLAIAFILAMLISTRNIKRAWQRQEQDLALLQTSQKSLRDAQEIAQLGSYSYDVRSGHWENSETLKRILHTAKEHPRDQAHWLALLPAESRQEMQAYFNAVIDQRRPFDREYRIINPSDGKERWLHERGEVRCDEQGNSLTMIGTIQDITERKQAEEKLRESDERNRTLLEVSPDGIWIHNNAKITYVNNMLVKMLDYGSAQDLIGREIYEFFVPEFREALRERVAKVVATLGSAPPTETLMLRRDQSRLEVETSATAFLQGQATWNISIIREITDRKQAELRIERLAFFDQLTGLPNRTLLLDRLKQAITASSRNGHYGALLFIDLDNFKTLNDTLGHDIGDLLLKQVAERLITCVRAGDSIARLGGDEFVVMLVNLSANKTDAASQAETVGEKILSTLNQAYQLNAVASRSTASIGVTLFRGDLATIDNLMKQADLAMYKAKAAGRNALRFYDPAMEVAVMARATLERDLREAIQEQQFVLHYQAQVVDEGRITGAEALVRWQHPRRGLVPPGEFITMAEETGLILPLGQWVLETACTQLVEWAARPESEHLTIAVNVSAQQFHQRDFVDQVLKVLDGTGANPKRLKLELTESLLVSSVQEVIEKMFALKGKGVGFSLDDFGTGYSSLSYLKRLPLDQLKIDQSFVRDVLSDPNDAAIANTIIALAKSLGLGVMAEGVETAAQRDFLASSGCHAYQGYFFSRPLPLKDFEAFANLGKREQGRQT